jgi:hypothetical protein
MMEQRRVPGSMVAAYALLCAMGCYCEGDYCHAPGVRRSVAYKRSLRQ